MPEARSRIGADDSADSTLRADGQIGHLLGAPKWAVSDAQFRGSEYVIKFITSTGSTNKQAGPSDFSLGTTDTLEAQNRYAAFLVEGHKIFNPSGSAAGLTVRQALNQYKTEHIDINVVDRVRAESAIRHLRAFFGDRPLHEIDIPASRAYAQARRAGAIGRKTRAE